MRSCEPLKSIGQWDAVARLNGRARSETNATCPMARSQKPSAAMASAVCPRASHNSCICVIFVEGQPTQILRQVLPPSLVDEKKESPDAIIRDLWRNQQPQHDHEERIRDGGGVRGEGHARCTPADHVFIDRGKKWELNTCWRSF